MKRDMDREIREAEAAGISPELIEQMKQVKARRERLAEKLRAEGEEDPEGLIDGVNKGVVEWFIAERKNLAKNEEPSVFVRPTREEIVKKWAMKLVAAALPLILAIEPAKAVLRGAD